MDKKRDRLEVELRVPLTVRVILTGMFGECTKCGEMKPASEFGFRVMTPDTGIIRNQPQCKDCR